MDYINRYLSAYENKIKMANQQGLFDAAIISCMVEAWHFHFGNRTRHEALNFDCAPEIVALYQKQMVESSVDAECAIDLCQIQRGNQTGAPVDVGL